MSKHTQQKLRDAFEARMTDNGKWPRAVEQGRNGCYLLAQTENAWVEWQACAEALATTEPEPTGMPEPYCSQDKHLSHPVFRQVLFEPGEYFSSDQMRAYGEQCWKAGYKHGAWGDKPAVNQQLTTEPIDERAARATLPTQRSSMDGLPKPFGYVSDGFADGLRFQHNPWPVEHTLLHSTLPVFSAAAVQQFKEDAKRYRWLADSNNYYEAINLISDGSLTEDALGKAIDAAMAKG